MEIPPTWFHVCLEHQVAISTLLGEVPQGQEGHLPPGQLPPQVDAVALTASSSYKAPAIAEQTRNAASKRTKTAFILINVGIKYRAIAQQNVRCIVVLLVVNNDNDD